MRRLVLVPLLALGILAVGVGASPAGRSAPATALITPSPAYTADQLAAPAGDNWLTVLGSLNGNRYSSLNQITPSNVATLKQAWKINLGTCATKDAGLRLPRGERGRRRTASITSRRRRATSSRSTRRPARRSGTGSPTYDPAFNVGTGGRQPGVAIGEGKVYAPTRDGYLVALDQILGGVVWKTEVIPWRKGGRVSRLAGLLQRHGHHR